ncbi:MAG: hypothetical protein V1492_03785 [Candidatus Micrarchaeota archaeon]
MSRHRNRRNMLIHGSEQVKLTGNTSAFAIGKKFDRTQAAKAGPKVEEKPKEASLSRDERERLWRAATPWKKGPRRKFVAEDVAIDFTSKGRPDLLTEFSKRMKKDPTSPDCEISPTDKKDGKGSESK